IEVRVDARRSAHVPRGDHRLRTGARGDLLHLIAVVVVTRKQHRDMALLHFCNDLLHVTGRRWDARLRLDVIDTRNLELSGEVIPLLVIAHHLPASERLTLLEPPPQPAEERRALVLFRGEEV